MPQRKKLVFKILDRLPHTAIVDRSTPPASVLLAPTLPVNQQWSSDRCSSFPSVSPKSRQSRNPVANGISLLRAEAKYGRYGRGHIFWACCPNADLVVKS
jgi:hypothetical protein